MKTTTTLLVLMILLVSVSLPAQKIGLTGGMAFANVTAKLEGMSVSAKMKPGFTAGLFTDFPVSSNFSFQPALNFVQKGSKSGDETYKDKLNYNYLEVSLNFVYNNSGFFIGAGPSISFGLSGKEEFIDKEDPSNSENTKVKFGSAEEEVKRCEFGANVLTGYKTAGGFMFSANYNLGLNNIANGDAIEGGTIKNKYFALKIGYVLHDSKRK
ncbi:MAG: porin family protein [Ginsengibacter sp.]